LLSGNFLSPKIVLFGQSYISKEVIYVATSDSRGKFGQQAGKSTQKMGKINNLKNSNTTKPKQNTGWPKGDKGMSK